MINKLMLIDDDSISLLLYDRIIKKSGFANEILQLRDGTIALDFFENLTKDENNFLAKAPDFIFLDINMPMYNGWDFLESYSQKFKDIFPNLKVSILSSSVDPEDLEKVKTFDMVIDFISKPLSPKHLNRLKENKHLQKYFNNR